MIQMQTLLEVADNSGAKQVKCLKVLGGSRRRYAIIGDIISVAVQETLPKTKVKAGDVVRAVIVRTVHDTRRKDGSTIRFDNNSVVLVSAQGEPVGTRVSGPVARELRGRRFTKIISLAPEVL